MPPSPRLRGLWLPAALLLHALINPAIAADAAQPDANQCSRPLQTAMLQIRSALNAPISTPQCSAHSATVTIPASEQETLLQLNASTLPAAEHHHFYGLASYYNRISLLEVNADRIAAISEHQAATLTPDHLAAAVGRFQVQLFDAPGATVSIDHSTDNIQLKWPPGGAKALTVTLLGKNELSHIDPGWSAIRYAHLWDWLASLAMAVEWSLIQIQRLLIANWGGAIILFAVLLKILLLPVSLITLRLQRQVSQYQATLAPRLDAIKAKYDGEQAHQRIMAAHKELGITPFYTLKPVLGSFIQIPVLVAVFNALGEMPQLAGAAFLWIPDLAYPDAIARLPTTLPMLGNQLNLLPIVMTLITLFSTLIYSNRLLPEAELRRQKRNLYLMSAAFLLLFYPFPAAMVLYWTLANLLQTIQQQLLKV